MEVDEKKKAKGSYVKPTGSVSGADLFQKSTKIIHPSSASSSRTEPPTVASSAQDKGNVDVRDRKAADIGMFTSFDR